jgi:hypothetical protein
MSPAAAATMVPGRERRPVGIEHADSGCAAPADDVRLAVAVHVGADQVVEQRRRGQRHIGPGTQVEAPHVRGAGPNYACEKIALSVTVEIPGGECESVARILQICDLTFERMRHVQDAAGWPGRVIAGQQNNFVGSVAAQIGRRDLGGVLLEHSPAPNSDPLARHIVQIGQHTLDAEIDQKIVAAQSRKERA